MHSIRIRTIRKLYVGSNSITEILTLQELLMQLQPSKCHKQLPKALQVLHKLGAPHLRLPVDAVHEGNGHLGCEVVRVDETRERDRKRERNNIIQWV